MTLQDALFLSRHDGWSQTDLDATDQDILDLMEVVDYERARLTQHQNREASAAARRRP